MNNFVLSDDCNTEIVIYQNSISFNTYKIMFLLQSLIKNKNQFVLSDDCNTLK